MDVTETVLVVYASAHGSTQEIAEYITARLAGSGLRVQAHSVVDAPDPAAFDAVVIGSAIHDRAWLPGARSMCGDSGLSWNSGQYGCSAWGWRRRCAG